MQPTINTTALVSFFMSSQVLASAASIYLLLALMMRALPPKVTASATLNRLLPILPEFMGIGLTFMPMMFTSMPAEFSPWVLHHIVTGMWIGMLSSKAYKIIDQSLLGNDDAIKPTVNMPMPLPTPAPAPAVADAPTVDTK